MALTPGDKLQVNEKSYLNNDQIKNFNTMKNTEDDKISEKIVIANFGPEPQILKCPHCNKFVCTKVKRKPTAKTHLYALLLCLGCCWICGLCLCPYCTGVFQDANHYCMECNTFLGTFQNN